MNKPVPFVGVVTHNPMATLRFDLLERTVQSIDAAFPAAELFLLDNGSTDGSWAAVLDLLGTQGSCGHGSCQLRGRWHTRKGSGHPEGNFTPGAGRWRLWHLMFGHETGNTADERAPFWVMSDDDMLWKPGAEPKLSKFWRGAREGNIAIVSGLLEPVWHWNTPREVVEVAGIRVLVRDSAPGAAWSFGNPRKIDVAHDPQLWRFGYDYESCKKLHEAGQRVAQIDLADHIGWGYSTHGNEADQHLDGRPLDREKWGV